MAAGSVDQGFSYLLQEQLRSGGLGEEILLK